MASFDGGPGGPKVGRANGSCVTTSGDPAAPGVLVCQISLALHDGEIETAGAFDTGPFFTGTTLPIAVTGGTGTYRQARGDGNAVIPDVADPSAVLFTLTTAT